MQTPQSTRSANQKMCVVSLRMASRKIDAATNGSLGTAALEGEPSALYTSERCLSNTWLGMGWNQRIPLCSVFEIHETSIMQPVSKLKAPRQLYFTYLHS